MYFFVFVFVEFYLLGWSLMVGGCWLIVVTPAAFTIACIFYANCSKVFVSSARRSLLNPGWAILSLGYPSPIIWFKSLIECVLVGYTSKNQFAKIQFRKYSLQKYSRLKLLHQHYQYSTGQLTKQMAEGTHVPRSQIAPKSINKENEVRDR